MLIMILTGVHEPLLRLEFYGKRSQLS